METSLKKWLDTYLQNVSTTHPVSIHLDVLIGTETRQMELIEASVKALNVLIDLLTQIGTPVQPTLVISLQSFSKKIEMLLPRSPDDLLQQADLNEPPSLYLIDWRRTRQAVICEELRIPLSLVLPGFSDKIYVYYREFRYGLAIQHDWEYSRAVYFEYFPDGPLIQ